MNSELAPDNPLAVDLDNLRKTRDELAATPATDLADNLETMHRIKWLAVEHQCPTLSRFGFGPECGEYLMGPEGNTIGIIKLENDTLSCDDARNIIDNHFVTTGYRLQPAPELNSELDDYLCYEFHEGVDENDIPMYMECAPAGESPVKTAWVFIKPKD